MIDLFIKYTTKIASPCQGADLLQNTAKKRARRLRRSKKLAIIGAMKPVFDLYSPQDIKGLEQSYRRSRLAAALLAGMTLIACVTLCALTDTGNAERMERTAVLISVLGGWTVIALMKNVVSVRKHELSHARMLQEGERSALEGTLSVSRERMHILGSIRFYPLVLQEGEEKRRSKVAASRAPRLRALEGKRVRLYTVNGYAAACEEL